MAPAQGILQVRAISILLVPIALSTNLTSPKELRLECFHNDANHAMDQPHIAAIQAIQGKERTPKLSKLIAVQTLKAAKLVAKNSAFRDRSKELGGVCRLVGL